MSYVKAWWALNPREKAELVWVVMLACVAEIAVKLVSLPRLTSALGIKLVGQGRDNDYEDRPPPRMDRLTVAKRARMVDRVYRHWPRERSCLRRAVVLGYRIRRAHPTLAIGVAREEDEIRAHAWIEVAGEVVGDDSGDWAPLRPHENAG